MSPIGPIQEFQTGEELSARKLNEMVRALNAVLNMTGSGPLLISKGPAGFTIGFSMQILRSQLPSIANGIVPGQITAVQEDNTPPCDHQYKAKAVDGRSITTYTSPDQPRDPSTLYIAAAEDDWCLMWWDANDVGHIFAIVEVFDTVLDS